MAESSAGLWHRRARRAGHEWALVGLGVGTSLALAAVAGVGRPPFLEVAAATTGYALIALILGRAGAAGTRPRFVAAYAYVLWFYLAVRRINPALGTPLRDGALYVADVALFGGTPAVLFQGLASPWATDLFSAGYLSYHVYLHLAIVATLARPRADIDRLAVPLSLAFAVGLLGYLLVPAVGPGTAYAEYFATPLAGGALTALNDRVVSAGSSVYDVFPSLHVLVTCVLLDHDWRSARRRFWVMLGPSGVLVVSTLYLRYHYAVDLLAGFAAFAAVRGVDAVGRRHSWGDDGGLHEPGTLSGRPSRRPPAAGGGRPAVPPTTDAAGEHTA